MDCNHARLLLEVAHPLATELAAHETADLAAHLADCPECGPWAEAEHRVDEKLGTAMRDVPVPAGLQLRLVRRLQVERDAWYRGWMVRAAGIAAALLFTCWVGYAAWFGKKPAPDLDELRFVVDDMPYNADLVQQKFAERGVAMTAPSTFEYTYLKGYGLTNFQGRQVPYLLFLYEGDGKNRPAVAQVYVVSSRQFNVDNLAQTKIAGSRQNIEVLPDPGNAQVFYVVVYTAGARLDVFYKPQPRDVH